MYLCKDLYMGKTQEEGEKQEKKILPQTTKTIGMRHIQQGACSTNSEFKIC